MHRIRAEARRTASTARAAPAHGAERRADADDRKQPLAALGIVDVVGERPELRGHDEVEDADPEKERDADVHAGDAEQIEDDQVRRKERA